MRYCIIALHFKIIKIMLGTVVLIFLAIIVLILVAGFFMEKSYRLSSSTVIDRPVSEVFNFVKHLRNQEKYSKWVMADPGIQLDYRGVDGTVGFISAWKSDDKNVGVGEQEITAIEEGKRYDVEIRFEKPFKSVSQAYTTTEAVDANHTRVTTTFEATTPYPMNLMTPMIKKMLQKDMDQNAAQLKAVLEEG